MRNNNGNGIEVIFTDAFCFVRFLYSRGFWNSGDWERKGWPRRSRSASLYSFGILMVVLPGMESLTISDIDSSKSPCIRNMYTFTVLILKSTFPSFMDTPLSLARYIPSIISPAQQPSTHHSKSQTPSPSPPIPSQPPSSQIRSSNTASIVAASIPQPLPHYPLLRGSHIFAVP